MEKVGAKDGYNTNEVTYKDKDIQYFMIISSSNILRVLGIPIIEGRDFSRADELSDGVSYIFNRPALAQGDILIALLIVTVITLLTVSLQNWKAANENPVNSIKSE